MRKLLKPNFASGSELRYGAAAGERKPRLRLKRQLANAYAYTINCVVVNDFSCPAV